MSSIPLGGVVRQLHRLAGAPSQEVSDGQLLERFRDAGEEAAFEALVRRHGPMVLGVCRRVLRDGHAAEDAFQATFLVLLRRARALDRGRSLAGWLYTVAYHVALRARTNAATRRRKEEAATPPAPAEPQAELLWRELRPVLDEELERLPEPCRAPVVLCYLEGRTNEEAARLLGWSVGTVKSRLARARDLLRTRLARRGVTLSVGLLTGTLAPAAAFSAILAHHTVQAALRTTGADPASAVAVALAEGVLSTMALAKLKMVAAFLLLAGLAALGVCAFAGQAAAQRHAPAPFTTDPPARAGANDPPPAPAKAAPANEVIALTGRILGGDGKPLAGARVAVLAGHSNRPSPQVLAEVRTDRAGKFQLRVRRPASAAGHEAVLAWASGHGPAWQYPLPEKGKELELKLPSELALRGRLIDLQGQPAAGVRLQVARLGARAAPNGWLVYRKNEGTGGTWQATTERPHLVRIRLNGKGADMAREQPPKETTPPPAPTVIFHEPPAHLPGWLGAVTTDKEGRFVLRGVGKGQGVGLRPDDERFALQVLDFPPRDRDEEVTQVLAPVRVLEGTLTDADTGKPVPNARARITPPGWARKLDSDFSESLSGTDARGRRGMEQGSFRLTLLTYYSLLERGEELPPLEACLLPTS